MGIRPSLENCGYARSVWCSNQPLARQFLLDWMYVDSATEFKRRTITQGRGAVVPTGLITQRPSVLIRLLQPTCPSMLLRTQCCL